jgi:hypothetical protein
MLIQLKEIRNIFNKNVYNKFTSDKYGINTSYCDNKIIENALLIYFIGIYEKITGINTIDMANLQPIIVNYITNNITSAASAYKHTQPFDALVWNVTHNLGFKPSEPLVTDENGNNLEGIVVNADIYNSTITFSHPQKGFAYFS